MQIINEVQPSDPEQIAALAEPGPDGPTYMVNLLKFKERAEYADGRETDLTGAEAFAQYGLGVVPLVEKHGGRVIFSGAVNWLMLGQADEMWDQVSVVEYPSRAALFAMATSEEYAEVSVHRDAGLEGQLNIETTGLFVP